MTLICGNSAHCEFHKSERIRPICKLTVKIKHFAQFIICDTIIATDACIALCNNP